MVFRPPYPYPMYPSGMRMPMPMQTPPQMSPQSFSRLEASLFNHEFQAAFQWLME